MDNQASLMGYRLENFPKKIRLFIVQKCTIGDDFETSLWSYARKKQIDHSIANNMKYFLRPASWTVCRRICVGNPWIRLQSVSSIVSEKFRWPRQIDTLKLICQWGDSPLSYSVFLKSTPSNVPCIDAEISPIGNVLASMCGTFGTLRRRAKDYRFPIFEWQPPSPPFWHLDR